MPSPNQGSTLYSPKQDALSLKNDGGQNAALDNLARIAPQLKGDLPDPWSRMAAGTYKGGSRKDVEWFGVGPGVIVSGAVTLDGTCRISHVQFPDGVTIAATAICIFTNCTFPKTTTMISGAKANYIGCFYADIQNAGAAGDANTDHCRKTGIIADLNITATGQI